MERMMKKKRLCRGLLLLLSMVIALLSFAGAVLLLFDSDAVTFGLQGLLLAMQKLPFGEVLFRNLLASEVILFVLCGMAQLLIFFALLRRHGQAVKSAMLSGLLLMLLSCIALVAVPTGGPTVAYFLTGFLETAVALALYRSESMER